MKKSLLLMIPMVMSMLVACGGEPVSSSQEATTLEPTSQEATTQEETTEETSEEETSMNDEFDIEDLEFLYYGQDPEPLKITNTERADEIVYEYDDEFIEIDENKVEVIKEIPVALEDYRYYFTKEIRVKATLGSVSKYFTVTAKRSGDRENKVLLYSREAVQKGVTEGEYTFVIGDSFFDKLYNQGWPNFYTDLSGKAFNCAIAGSTFEEWFDYLPKLVYKYAPKYLAIHLGSNDFWDLHGYADHVYHVYQLFMERIHAHLPETKIIFYSVENRGYLMPQATSWEHNNGMLEEFNRCAKEYAESTDYITFVDSLSYLCNENYSIKTELFFPDQCHPLPITHDFYITKMLEAGVEDVTYNPTVIPEGTPETFTRTASQSVGSGALEIQKAGKSITKEVVVTGDIAYSYNTSANAHFEFGLDTTHFQNRFLLWNNSRNGKLNYAAVYGANHNMVSSNNPIEGASGTFTFMLLISNKNCYLFINGVLKEMIANFTPAALSLSSEEMNIEGSNIKVTLKGEESQEYEDALELVGSYEAESSTSPQARVF